MSKTFLYASSAVSTQTSLSSPGFMEKLVLFEDNRTLVEPDYKEYIDPMMIRRMRKSTKMSIACALECLCKTGIEQPDSIIVGTGLGALADTENFLKVSTSTEQKLIPPTSFIQSGHNTIAGQIALLLKNDSYNMTHVQQAVSFEHALLDALLNISEGKRNVLVGAVDEHNLILTDLANKFGLNERVTSQLSEGAGFFLVGPDESLAVAEIHSVSIVQTDNIAESVGSFLSQNGVGKEGIAMGFVGYNLTTDPLGDLPFKTICYTDFSGRHFSSSAFGFYFASRFLQHYDKKDDYVIVINCASDRTVGLSLLKYV